MDDKYEVSLSSRVNELTISLNSIKLIGCGDVETVMYSFVFGSVISTESFLYLDMDTFFTIGSLYHRFSIS